MAVPAHLLEEVMRLPEADRRELTAYLVTLEEPEPEGEDREALLASLARSEADVQAGRTHRMEDVLAEIRDRIKSS
jgi:hypothetical protein